MTIRLDQVSKSFGHFQALEPTSLTLPEQQITALLGPSGSGKTTLLRIVAGLETADQGRILFHERDVTHLPVRQRRVGFVFQNYALFRHMTVADNIAFGLRMQKRHSRAFIHQRVTDLLAMVQLPHLAQRYPAQLSGGQKQRIALARALAIDPDILLLDEPFGALDAKVRQELRRALRDLQEKLGFTTLFVTHDQEEALELSDQVILMNHGRVAQTGTPAELFNRPGSRFAFEFLGHVNEISGRLAGQRLEQGDAWLDLPEASTGSTDAREHRLMMRPHEVRLAAQPTARANLPLQVSAVSLVGSEVRIELAARGWEAPGIWALSLRHKEYDAWPLQRGDEVYAIPDVAHLSSDSASPRTLYW